MNTNFIYFDMNNYLKHDISEETKKILCKNKFISRYERLLKLNINIYNIFLTNQPRFRKGLCLTQEGYPIFSYSKFKKVPLGDYKYYDKLKNDSTITITNILDLDCSNFCDAAKEINKYNVNALNIRLGPRFNNNILLNFMKNSTIKMFNKIKKIKKIKKINIYIDNDNFEFAIIIINNFLKYVCGVISNKFKHLEELHIFNLNNYYNYPNTYDREVNIINKIYKQIIIKIPTIKCLEYVTSSSALNSKCASKYNNIITIQDKICIYPYHVYC